MKVSELGEFGLIDLLAEKIADSANQKYQARQQLIAGIGDDAAAWYGDASTRLATVDSLIQDIHFSLSTTPWRELGWKSLSVNLSDIAAMGGVPGYALVSLALPGNTEVADVASLYEGMIEVAQKFETAIVGGDTCQASPTTSRDSTPAERMAGTARVRSVGSASIRTGSSWTAARAPSPVRTSVTRG